MEAFQVFDAVAVPLDESNVDTDQICPARLIRSFAEPGPHDHVFLHDRRHGADGRKLGFVLDQPAYAGARILVAQRNFGVGSSREAAVFALVAFGLRAVIAESFGDIFVGNCLQNGVLPVALPAAAVDALRASVQRTPGAHIVIDLPRQTATGPDGRAHPFAIGARRKRCLLEGLTDLELTERQRDAIDAFERAHRERSPWLFPAPDRNTNP
ncbi:MAG: 3-isopropylmalate dehydratase small subunit [Rubrivivax sp.]|nr:3-isopropylmalate dehydratase small subunit [Rubrivivax sp.]